MPTDNDTWFEDLVSRVDRGDDVDWDAAEQSRPDPRERSRVRNLRSVYEIWKHPRSTESDPSGEAGKPNEVDEPSSPDAPHQSPDSELPRMWGHLELRGVIGEGTSGTVYDAWDERLATHVALKQVYDPNQLCSFEEARGLARVRHPNVLIVHGVEHRSGWYGMWTERVEGETLERLLERTGRMSAAEACAIGIPLSQALAAVHNAGLIHGDVKCDNAMRERGGRIVLMDFGLVTEQTHDTSGQRVRGTPLYMAPELFDGKPRSQRSDIYALGVLLFRLVNLEYPVPTTSLRDIMRFHEEGNDARPLWDLRPDLPAEFVELVQRCLARAPTDRYASVGEVAAALLMIGGSAPGLTIPDDVSSTGPTSDDRLRGSELVGRTDELREVLGRIREPNCRILTILGTGGVGKTTLARRVSQLVAGDFPGGVWFVDLSDAFAESDVGRRVLNALGIEPARNEAAEDTVVSALSCRPPLLCVIDNAEQISASVSTALALWTAGVPHTRFLVTSRVPLNLTLEERFELAPLSLSRPEAKTSPDAHPLSEAAELFVRRASAVRPSDYVATETLEAIDRICEGLDGIPLAIELAASRIRIFGVTELAERLRADFSLLKSRSADRAERQRTLDRAIQWSYELLSRSTRNALLHLSVFRGGFDIGAAEAVLDDLEFDDLDPTDAVEELCDHNLLRTVETTSHLRFRFYHPVRRWCEKKLTAESSPVAVASAEECHARHYARRGQDWLDLLLGPQIREGLDRLTFETENLIAAHDWGMRAKDSKVAVACVLTLSPTRVSRAPFPSYVERLHKTLTILKDDEPRLRLQVLLGLATVAHEIGDPKECRRSATKAARVAEQLADPGLIAEAQIRLAFAAQLDQQFDEGRRHLDLATESLRAEPDSRCLANILLARQALEHDLGRLDESINWGTRAAKIFREIGDLPGLAGALGNMGIGHAQRAQFTRAIENTEEALAICRDLEDRPGIARHLGNLGLHLQSVGRLEESLEFSAEAEQQNRELGRRRALVHSTGNQGIAHLHLGHWTEAVAKFEESSRIAKDLGLDLDVSRNQGHLGIVMNKTGDLERALEYFAEAEKLAGRFGPTRIQLHHVINRAGALLEGSRYAEAALAFKEANAICRPTQLEDAIEGFLTNSGLAFALWSAGDREAVPEPLREARRLAATLALTSDHRDPEIAQHVSWVESLEE